MIQLFASDLDGTLLNESHESDDIILNSIQYVHDHNRYFAIATGRDINGSLRNTQFGKMGIYMICMNGAIIANPNKEIIFKKEISKDFLKHILNEFPDIHFDCTSSNATYVRSSKEDYLDHFSSQSIWKILDFSQEKLNSFIENHHFNCTDEEILTKDILKLNCRVDNTETKQKLDDFISNYSHCVANAPFDKGSYEITDVTVNKGNAIMFLANYLHINPNEVAVYGDGGNDLEMLEMFEHSYATENASNEAKKRASKVIGNCKDHAVPYHIIETIG